MCNRESWKSNSPLFIYLSYFRLTWSFGLLEKIRTTQAQIDLIWDDIGDHSSVLSEEGWTREDSAGSHYMVDFFLEKVHFTLQ